MTRATYFLQLQLQCPSCRKRPDEDFIEMRGGEEEDTFGFGFRDIHTVSPDDYNFKELE